MGDDAGRVGAYVSAAEFEALRLAIGEPVGTSPVGLIEACKALVRRALRIALGAAVAALRACPSPDPDDMGPTDADLARWDTLASRALVTSGCEPDIEVDAYRDQYDRWCADVVDAARELLDDDGLDVADIPAGLRAKRLRLHEFESGMRANIGGTTPLIDVRDALLGAYHRVLGNGGDTAMQPLAVVAQRVGDHLIRQSDQIGKLQDDIRLLQRSNATSFPRVERADGRPGRPTVTVDDTPPDPATLPPGRWGHEIARAHAAKTVGEVPTVTPTRPVARPGRIALVVRAIAEVCGVDTDDWTDEPTDAQVALVFAELGSMASARGYRNARLDVRADG